MPELTILSTGVNPKLRRKVEAAAKAHGVDVEYAEPTPDAGLFETIDDIRRRKRMAPIVILDGHGCVEEEGHVIGEDRGRHPVTGEELTEQVPTAWVIDRLRHGGARQGCQPQWQGVLIVQSCEIAAMREAFRAMSSPVIYYGEQRALKEAVSNSATRELIRQIGQSKRRRGVFIPHPVRVFKWLSRVSGDRVELVRGHKESLVSVTARPEDLGRDASSKKIAQAFGVRVAVGTCEEVSRFLDRWPNLLSEDLLGKSDAIFIALGRDDNQRMLQFLIGRGALKAIGLDAFVSYGRNARLLLPYLKTALFDELVARLRAAAEAHEACAPVQRSEIILDAAEDMLLDLCYSIAPDAQLECLAIWRGLRGFDADSDPGVYEELFVWMAQTCAEATGKDARMMERFLGGRCAEIDKLDMKEVVSPAALEQIVDSALARGDDGVAWLLAGPIPALADLASRHPPEDWEQCRQQADKILYGFLASRTPSATGQAPDNQRA